MNQRFLDYLQGVITVISKTEIKMNFYWSSSDKSIFVELSGNSVENKEIYPDDEFDYDAARVKFNEQLHNFLISIEEVE